MIARRALAIVAVPVVGLSALMLLLANLVDDRMFVSVSTHEHATPQQQGLRSDWRGFPCEPPGKICGFGPPTHGLRLTLGTREWDVEFGVEGCSWARSARTCGEIALPSYRASPHARVVDTSAR
jgi:hypothetical protein